LRAADETKRSDKMGDGLLIETNLDYLAQPERQHGEALQAEMLRLQAEGWEKDGEALWEAAVDSLGGQREWYVSFYVCRQCGQMYHGDYSANSDPDREFCGAVCESNWLAQHPDEAYGAELRTEYEAELFASSFVEAVQTLESATQMQWDHYDWLNGSHSLFSACSLCSPERNDGLLFCIAGNQSPEWAERLNGWPLDNAARAAHQAGAIDDSQLRAVLDYFSVAP
jgi:hypothetical protein